MKISYNWLKQFVKTDWDAAQVEELLTDLGLEVEGIETFESIPGGLKGLVVGEVKSCEQHPNADRLKLTKVDVGQKELLSIVCGAPNVAKGQKVVVATVGTVLHPTSGEPFTIKKSKIRGELSQGMICAEDEIGIGLDHDGIIVLNDKHPVGKACADIFEIENDEVFEIGLTPNRADAMSHFGVARDLKAGWLQQGINTELIRPNINGFHVELTNASLRIDVVDKKRAPRYCGLRISGVQVGPSPDYIQNKLKAIGLTPINNIVDATNYVLHELGQPLHAFDASAISSGVVKVQTLKEGTSFTTLDGVERTLSAEDLMICDGDTPMCIAGVFGGLHSGVSEKTTEVFLESAYFDPVSVRKSAKRHGLSTDASFRFERGIDIELVEYALKRAALLIIELAGGHVSSNVMDEYPTKAEPVQFMVQFDYISSLIGEEIPRETVKSILTSLDIKINNVTETALALSIPPYRVDVTRPADVVEEVLRVYGYNNIQFSNKLSTSLPEVNFFDQDQWERKIGRQLVDLGFFEIYNNSLTTPANDNDKEIVRLINPLSNELSSMRTELIGGVVDAVVYNVNRRQKHCKMFEFGNVYTQKEGAYHQSKRLIIAASGNQHESHWIVQERPTDFYFIKGIVKAITDRTKIDISEEAVEHGQLFSCVALMHNKQCIGHIGQVKNDVFTSLDEDTNIFVAYLDWDVLTALAGQPEIRVKPLSKFPSVKRDMALLIDEVVAFSTLRKLAFETEKKLLESVQLFDVYQGKGIPQGKKSYGLTFTISDQSKTLTDKQVDKITSKIFNRYQKEFAAELR
jgi:phenylalanyl-tRNA synthetase beta chain